MSATNATLRYPAAPPGRSSLAGSVRLLRLELRHSAMLWIAPILGALFYFTTYRQVIALPALWDLRRFKAAGEDVTVFAPFVAGAAAWIGSRDGRRATGELVAATARSRWSTRVAAWVATTCWATVIYLDASALSMAWPQPRPPGAGRRYGPWWSASAPSRR